MTRADAIEEISKQIPDCEKCPLIVANCKKQGHYDGCKKQREAIKTAIEALSIDIIRCKDCKHNYLDGIQVRFNRCELNHSKVHADDWFCADGCLPEIMTPPRRRNENNKNRNATEETDSL